MGLVHRYVAGCLGTAALCAAAACSTGAVSGAAQTPTGETNGDTTSAAARHDHAHTGGETLPPAGDGTAAYEIGYTLRDVRLPKVAGVPGRISFVIENYRGHPQTGFLTELSKKMHVYVVREDLAVFRHVHPRMRRDGTWSGPLTLPEPGRYRVVAEFMARDEGGDGDFVMLGDRVRVPGAWEAAPTPSPDGSASTWGVEAAVVGEVTAGGDGQLRIRLATPEGRAPALGEYLGTSAHLTGFHAQTGGAVHMHPLGTPVATDDAAELAFHTQLPTSGTYVLFLQVRVDRFLHTLPLTVSAS